MLARGLIGEKAGQGFYKRVKGAGRQSEILTLDPSTLEYVPDIATLPALESARRSPTSASVSRRCSIGTDRVGQFLRETLAPTLVYAAQITPRIAQSADDVDRVMRWGFGWDLGPFEMADAIGVDRVIEVAVRSARHCSKAASPRAVAQRTKAPVVGTARSSRTRRTNHASSRRTPAPAWWTSATVCWRSSSTAR